MRRTYLHCLSQEITPETTIIVFDLHNVVFKKQTRKMVTSFIKLKGSWRYTLNPLVWYCIYRLRKQSAVAEDIFHKVSREYPGIACYRNDFIKITNAQKPIAKVVELIKELKARGYNLYVLSNIGRETYEQLSAYYPDVSGCFDGAFTACAEMNYEHKPHPGFYEQFKKYITEQGQAHKQILFVDDLKQNLIAAALCNIAGVLFTSPKKLVSTFKNLSIL